MSIEEAINPVVDFFHKLLGRHLWIVPTAISATSWIVYKIDETKWYLLYMAILFGLITGLYIMAQLFALIKNGISKIISKRKTKRRKLKEAECVRSNEIRRREEHASIIWKLVCHTDKEILDAALHFLDLEIFDGNKYIRYLPLPKNEDYQGRRVYDAFNQIADHFYYPSHATLVERERSKEGLYFQIESYFYSLLESYATTKTWKKL